MSKEKESGQPMLPVAINGGFIGQRTTGLQRYAWEVSSRLIDKGHYTLLYPSTQKKPDLPDTSIRSVTPPVFHNKIKALWDVRLPRSLDRSQLLWSPCNLGPPIPRHVVTIHDLSVLRNPKWFSRGFALKYQFLIPRIVRNSLKIITDTETVKCEISERFPEAAQKIEAIPLGVTDHLIKHANTPLPGSLVELTKKPYYVTLGSIDPRKNLPFLLNEWRLFQEQRSDINLLVIGGHSDAFSSLKIIPPQNTHFLGYLDDAVTAPLIKRSLGMIYPSVYEGFSFPPLEALSLGCPALVSDIPVHRENFHEWANFFSPFEEGSLLTLLEAGHTPIQSIDSLKEALETKFNWNICANRTHTALQEAHVHI